MKCEICGNRAYSIRCVRHKIKRPIAVKTALPRPTKRIRQIGKKTITYNQWRDEVARPYLIAMFGEVCVIPGCTEATGLDVDHKLNRGSHPELKMVLTNVQLICRPHHQAKTDRL